MTTRSQYQLCTRSGNCYRRINQNDNFLSHPLDTVFLTSKTKENINESVSKINTFPMEENRVFSPDTISSPNQVLEFKEPSFEDWLNEVKTHLKNTFEITEDEVGYYPFYNWFLEKLKPMVIANRIRRDFFQDEEQYYVEPFYKWQQEVDKLITSHLGLSRLDVPDFPYYDCFCEMFSPMKMVNFIQQELLII